MYRAVSLLDLGMAAERMISDNGQSRETPRDLALRVTRLADRPSFARLPIQSRDDTTTVDLATDACLMATARTDAGDVLALADLAADKVFALEGRAEVRDFVDSAALTKRFTVAELCALAARKGRRLQARTSCSRPRGLRQPQSRRLRRVSRGL